MPSFPTNDSNGALQGKVGEWLNGRFPTKSELSTAVTGLQGALDGKSDTGHGHTISDVSGLQSALDAVSNQTDPVRLAFNLAMRNRNVTPVKILCAGSSTMNGGVASSQDRQIVHRMAAWTSKNPVRRDDLSNTSATDVQWWEIADGGTNSGNYLTDTRIAEIGVLKPNFMLHSIGSNDYQMQMDPATYKTNLRNWMVKLRNASIATRHVFIVQQPRNDGAANRTHNWWVYTEKLNELKAEWPNEISVADFGPDFQKIGLPGLDIWGLVSSDQMHMGDEGQRIFSEWILRWLGVPVPTPTTERFATSSNTVASANYTGPQAVTPITIPAAPYPRTGRITANVFMRQEATGTPIMEFAIYPTGTTEALAPIDRNFFRAPTGQGVNQTLTMMADIDIPPHHTATYAVRYNSAASIYLSGSTSYTRAYVELDPA